MKTKNTALVLVLGFAGSVVCLAKDANLGTWKLNEANSRSSPGAPKNLTVAYKAARGDMKVIVDVRTPMENRPTMNGAASLMAKTIRSPAIRLQTSEPTRRWTILPTAPN